jgi:hypothetical protein
MKTAASLGLLVLLLSHSLGWSLAVFFSGKKGSMPERQETSQSSAWHRFSELSERMQEMQLAKAPPTPLGSVLKLLNDLAKTYLPGTAFQSEWQEQGDLVSEFVRFAEPFNLPVAGVLSQATPPPEMIG